MDTLNSDHLRTFLAIQDAGSVSGGATRINRSQSATSLQIRQLEETVGKPLFHRHGRGVRLTAAGESLLPVARRVVRSLDSALSELRGGGLTGRLRMGMPDDYGRAELTTIIADFAARHPDVELDVHCALGSGFETALDTGALDLAVREVPRPSRHDRILREGNLMWMGSGDRDFTDIDPLPVALFDRDCWWRDLALTSLEKAGRQYKVIFTSESAAGVKAAARAGVAAALLNESEATRELQTIADLPQRHPTFLILERARGVRGPTLDAMCDTIAKAFSV
ncbi:MAG: LysR family transcriptional regulator [Pseudomonadota bacterium]